MAEILEREPTTFSIDEIEQDFLSNLEVTGIQISPSQFKRLIPKIELGNTELHDEIKEKFSLDTVFATVDSMGAVSLSEDFQALSPEKQRYVLAHELGHRIDSITANADRDNRHNEKISRLRNAASRITIDNSSDYCRWMDESLENKTKADEDNLRREIIAESLAQYITGGGTFEGMMAQKIESLADDQPPMWLENVDTQSLVSDIGNIPNLSEEELSDYLDNNPKIAQNYELYNSIHDLLSEDGLVEDLLDEYEGVYDDWDFVDYEQLAARESQPSPPPEKTLKTPKKKFWIQF